MRLFLLFLTVPLIEIALFIQIGGAIGLLWTILIVILTALFGTILVRSQGLSVLISLRSSFSELRDPTEPLAHGAMILFSGALLLTPGFFTDAIGFALLVPGIRSALFSVIKSRINIQTVRYGDRADRPSQEGFVDADYEVIDEAKNHKQNGPSGWTRH